MRFGSPKPAGLVLAGLFAATAPSGVGAQQTTAEVETPRDAARLVGASSNDALADPPRYVATVTLGAPLRVTRRVDFDQDLLAPLYADVLAGYVWSSTRRVRHGVGLGLSLNVTSDGGFTEPVDPATQLVVMPSYLLYASLADAWLLLGHVGIPLLAAGGRSAGFELGAGAGYRWRAGAGAYAEAGVNGFAGGDSTLHLTASLELGVFVDYEVLP